MTPCAGVPCCVASLYVGGGGGVNSSGLEFCRGGSRGGRLGFGLGGGAGDAAEAAPGRKAGGLGRWAVLNPVVLDLYGPGASLLASSSACRRASSLSCSLCLAPAAGADASPVGERAPAAAEEPAL